jgi:hypothetical protein
MASVSRGEHWDDHVLWEGTARPWWRRRSSDAAATTYRLTRDALHIEAAGDPPLHEIIPLWIITGVTPGRSALQRLRGVGSVNIRLDSLVRPIQIVATIADIHDAPHVATLVLGEADRARRIALADRAASDANDAGTDGSQHGSNLGSGGLSASQELRELAALHDAGVIDDDEFAILKAKIVDR